MSPRRRITTALLSLVLTIASAACAGTASVDDGSTTHEERPARMETLWTDAHEWFVEHPLFVRGETATIAAHLTILDGFEPATAGRLEAALLDGSGAVQQRVTAEAPARPGIFLPELTPDAAGSARLRLTYTTPSGATDRVAWDVRVARSPDRLGDAPAVPEGIAFLKEQQWRIPFATEAVRSGTIRETIELPATIEPHPRATAVVAAPAAGIYRPPASGLPTTGTELELGEPLGELGPLPGDREGWHTARADLVQARNRVAAAEREHARAERLVEAGAVPDRRLVEARTALEDARARLRSARARTAAFDRRDEGGSASGDRLLLRAPLAGVLAEVRITEGEPVDPQRPLFRIVDLDRLVARVEAPEPELQRLLEARGRGHEPTLALRSGAGTAERTSDVGGWIEGGRLLELGTELDPESRTASVRYELRGAGDRLRPGMSAVARLRIGAPREASTVPASALLDLAGVEVVYVQLGGETFEERVVRTGSRDDARLEVLAGLEPGDRVVTRGAYQVRLASLSPDAAPEHSH